MSDNEETNTETLEKDEVTDLTVSKAEKGVKRQKLRHWVQRLAIALAVLGPLVFLIAALGYRMGALSLKTSLLSMSFKVGPLVLLCGLVVSFLAVALSWFIKPSKGLIISLLALAVPVFGLFSLSSMRAAGSKLPAIHDITTDPEDPPRFTDAIIDARKTTKGANTLDYFEKKDREGGTLVSVLQSKHYPEIQTVRRSEDPDTIYKEAEALLNSKGWTLVTADPDDRVLEATATTFWYGFKDDVILRIQPSKNGGTLVDMRSVSRVGRSDLGLNAKRLGSLIEALSPK